MRHCDFSHPELIYDLFYLTIFKSNFDSYEKSKITLFHPPLTYFN